MFLSAPFAFGAGVALAQQTAAIALPETLVTATRDEEKTERVANSITVVDRAAIEQRQYRTLADLLNDVPGLASSQSGIYGKSTGLFVRGTNSNHTLVLIDGLRANDPASSGGTFNFAHLLADMVERVEIVRGPLSTLYGSDALGGVINVITRKGKGKPSGTVQAEGGSFGTVAGSAAVQGGIGRFNFNVGAAGFTSNGISSTPERLRPPGVGAENDPYRNLTLNARLGAEVTDNFELSLFGRYISSRSQYDNWPSEDPNLRETTEQFYGRALGELWLMDGRWKQSFGLGYVHITRHDKDDVDPLNPFPFSLRTENRGRRLKADWQNDLAVTEFWKLTFGIEGEREWLDSDTDGFTRAAAASTVGAFVQNRFILFDRLFLTLAARLDRHDDFGANPTFSAGIAYLHRETDTKLKASVGTAYKAPSLYQRYGAIPPFFVGNPDLKPEKSLGFDAGFEQGLADRRITLGSTFFWNDIRNLIECAPGFCPTLINVGKARTYGLESFVATRPAHWIELRLDHTWTHAENRITGDRLQRRPRHKVTGTIDLTPVERLKIGLAITYNGSREDIDPNTYLTFTNERYILATLTASYRLLENVEIYGRLHNVFDASYEDPSGYAQPGFAAFAGTRVKF